MKGKTKETIFLFSESKIKIITGGGHCYWNHEGGFPLWASCYRSRHSSDTWNQRYVNRNLLPQYVKFLGSLTKPGLRTIKNSQSEVALTWLDVRTLRIRFADNSTDLSSLKLANNIPGIVVQCLFLGTLVAWKRSAGRLSTFHTHLGNWDWEICINCSGTLDSDPEAVVSVSGCKVGFCLKQEMYSTEKKDKPCKTRMQCI